MGCAWHAYGGALSTAEGAARRCLQPVGGGLAVGGARGEVVEQHVALDEVVVGHALAQGGGQAGRAEERIEDAHRPPAMHGCRCKMYMRVTLEPEAPTGPMPMPMPMSMQMNVSMQM